MDGSQQSTTIAALDIGTSKITVAVATVSDEEGLERKGFGKVPSKGIHAGSVQDVVLLKRETTSRQQDTIMKKL